MNDNYTHKEQEEEARKTEGKRKEKKECMSFVSYRITTSFIFLISFFLKPAS